MIIIKYIRHYHETGHSVPATLRDAPEWFEAYLRDPDAVHTDHEGKVFTPKQIEVIQKWLSSVGKINQ